MLWILISWGFPVIGPLLYLTAGIDRLPQKGFMKRTRDAELHKARATYEEALPLAYWRGVNTQTTIFNREHDIDLNLYDALNTISPEYPLLDGNDIIPLVSGDELYPDMLDAISNASHHIHIQSFIIRNDPIGRKLMKLLADKAREGVQVRLLYDRFGSMQALFSGLFRPYRKIQNFQIAGWTQVSLMKRQFQLNLRNHRKAVIIDGTTAFMGGINIHIENTSRQSKPAIRDYHFKISGPAVQEIQYAFMRDWYFMTEEDPEIILQSVYFPSIEKKGKAAAALVCGGPTNALQVITDIYFMAITRAKNQIIIVTPYFVPTTDIIRALRSAAIRGVDVRLILPAKNNHFYAGWASHALYDELLQSGIRIFARTEPFMHAKAMLVDDDIAIIGTANWDVRSLKLNYETNMAVINSEFSNCLKRIILEDEAASNEIDLAQWRSRPQWHRLLENACSLMTPML